MEEDISIVYTKTTHFSAVMDSLYFDFDFAEDERIEKHIIYNDSKIVFYGFPLYSLKHCLVKYGIPKEDLYSGGGDAGYIGISVEVLSKKKINEIVELISKSANCDFKLNSSHIFMFPFRFDFNKNGFEHEFDFYRDTEINDRVKIKTLNDLLKSDTWEYEKFDMNKDRHLLYSEFSYFYDYARESIYNLQDFSFKAVSNFYRKKIFDQGTYQITVKTKYFEKSYDLLISGITLKVFSTGIAILSIELDNYLYPDFEDVLYINDFGRRVYPQFIGANGVSDAKESFLADKITLFNKKGTIRISENFENLNLNDIEIGNHIMELLGSETFSKTKSEKEKFYIQPSLDDRMFVLSWYGNDAVSEGLQKCNSKYSGSDDWYKYLFNDTTMATVQNQAMKEKLLKEATYDRWSNFGGLIGITRYSFMMLSASEPTLKANNAAMIIDHSKTMYFQMVNLLLATRTSILRFSDEITPIASPEHKDKLAILYEKYLNFYNRLYFKEVTHQDQGIELYDIGLSQMKIPEHMDKLDGKFTKLFEYVNLKDEKERNDRLEKISVLGAVFLPPSLLAGIYGVNVFNYQKTPETLIIALAAMLLSSFIGYWAIRFKKKEKKEKKNKNIRVLVTGMLLIVVIVGSLFWIGEDKSIPVVRVSNDQVQENKSYFDQFLSKLEKLVPNINQRSSNDTNKTN